jgi:hypothetical protein
MPTKEWPALSKLLHEGLLPVLVWRGGPGPGESGYSADKPEQGWRVGLHTYKTEGDICSRQV